MIICRQRSEKAASLDRQLQPRVSGHRAEDDALPVKVVEQCSAVGQQLLGSGVLQFGADLADGCLTAGRGDGEQGQQAAGNGIDLAELHIVMGVAIDDKVSELPLRGRKFGPMR